MAGKLIWIPTLKVLFTMKKMYEIRKLLKLNKTEREIVSY